MATFDAGTPATRYAQARAEGVQRGFYGDNADAYVRDNYPEIFAGMGDNVPDLSIAKNPELLAPIEQAQAQTQAQTQAQAQTSPSVEEGINQSYLDIFKRPASQDEINFYVKEFGADNVYDAGEKVALESRLAASVGDTTVTGGGASVGDTTVTGGGASVGDTTITGDQVQAQIGNASSNTVASPLEREQYLAGLQNLYNRILFREADPVGIAGFQGKSLTDIEKALRSSPEAGGAAKIRQAYQGILGYDPSDEEVAFYSGADQFGDVVSPAERQDLIGRLRGDQLNRFQNALGIPAAQFSPGRLQPQTPLDFSSFGVTPATAGIERLRPTDTTGTMIGAFESPQLKAQTEILQRAPFDPTAERSRIGALADVGPTLFPTFQDIIREDVRQSDEAEEGKRGGGIASLGYRRGGVVDENGIPRLFIGGLFKGIGRALKGAFKGVTKIAPFILPFIPGFQGLALGNQALLGGIAGGFASGDGKFDLKRALTSGLTTYGIGSLAKAAGTPVGPESGGVDAGGGISIEPGTGAAVKSGPTGIEGFQGGSTISTAKNVVGVDPMITGNTGQTLGFDPRTLTTQTGQSINTGVGRASYSPFDTSTAGASTAPSGFGLDRLKAEAVGTGQRISDTFKGLTSGDIAAKELITPALTTVGGIAATKAGDEIAKQEAEYKALTAADAVDRERKRKRILEILKANPFGYAEGGISSLPPRYLDGMGDGMSDSIKANIGGMQEARLADGEFVVPADVVADLGNGSSNAGAERLYSMMDRIREARHGTTKQPPEVNVNKALPA